MLHHVHGDDAKQQGMREMFRVLKPGGRLLIVGREMLAHSVDAFVPMLEQAGFVQIETGPTSSSFLGYHSGEKPI